MCDFTVSMMFYNVATHIHNILFCVILFYCGIYRCMLIFVCDINTDMSLHAGIK